MKIRQGFISNSSSTSFTFIVKGNTAKDVYKAMKDYGEYFHLWGAWRSEENEECFVSEVIDSLIEIENGAKLESIVSTKKRIEEHIKKLDYVGIEENKQLECYWLHSSVRETEKLMLIEEAIKNGFRSVFVVGFGDNHGEICGDKIGYLMDYEGRHIRINKPDFIVFTEQNR